MCSTENLKTKKKETPRVVMYTSTEGEIAATYIVADETVRIKIAQPTVSRVIVVSFKCILCLVHGVSNMLCKCS